MSRCNAQEEKIDMALKRRFESGIGQRAVNMSPHDYVDDTSPLFFTGITMSSKVILPNQVIAPGVIYKKNGV